jgi:hypothetical protein
MAVRSEAKASFCRWLNVAAEAATQKDKSWSRNSGNGRFEIETLRLEIWKFEI